MAPLSLDCTPLTEAALACRLFGTATGLGSLLPSCSGSRSGHIHHHDVRVAEHHVATLSGHSQEVCGLRWAPDGRHLASGGNDNLVNVWPSAPGEGGWVPLQTFTQHQGAVKVRVGLGWASADSHLEPPGDY